jgi:hypothetical protein
MFKNIILGLLVAVGLLCVVAAMKPSEYTIAREIPIKASPEKIFPLINNAKETGRWMPWADMDPQMKMNYSGPEAGVGSKASWESPGKMGTGSSTVSESIENQAVKFDLEYVKPFQMKQSAEISIRPSGDQSLVKWSVSGRSQFVARLMCIFMNMDKMVGGSFEQGLAKLKVIAEQN